MILFLLALDLQKRAIGYFKQGRGSLPCISNVSERLKEGMQDRCDKNFRGSDERKEKRKGLV